MPRIHINTIVAVLSVLLLSQPIAQAEVLTYGFSGVISSHDNSTDLPIEDTFPVGMPCRLVFTFDSTVPILQETQYPNLNRARYNSDEATSGRIFSAMVTFGDQSYEQIIQDYGRVGSFNLEDNIQFSSDADPDDWYVVKADYFPDINGIEIANAGVVLIGDSDAHDGVSLGM